MRRTIEKQSINKVLKSANETEYLKRDLHITKNKTFNTLIEMVATDFHIIIIRF